MVGRLSENPSDKVEDNINAIMDRMDTQITEIFSDSLQNLIWSTFRPVLSEKYVYLRCQTYAK